MTWSGFAISGVDNEVFVKTMVSPKYAFTLTAVALASTICWSCQSGGGSGSGVSTNSDTAATPSGSGSAKAPPVGSTEERADDDVKPVYPQTNDPPDPVAERYCNLIYEEAEKKRKECCPNIPFMSFRPTGECVRTLSFALHSKAMVIEKADLDGCETAIAAAAKQCDWGGEMPAACKGILRGQIPEKETCRSSLECKDGLYCAGLGVSAVGKCSPPRPDGYRCGGGADSLGAFVQQDVEAKHQQCQGVCDRRKCASALKTGEKCLSSVQCGETRICKGGKCADGALPKAGEKCFGAICEAGNRCLKGTCVVERRVGEECADDGECRSTFFEKSGGAKGVCKMSCQVIRPASPKP